MSSGFLKLEKIKELLDVQKINRYPLKIQKTQKTLNVDFEFGLHILSVNDEILFVTPKTVDVAIQAFRFTIGKEIESKTTDIATYQKFKELFLNYLFDKHNTKHRQQQVKCMELTEMIMKNMTERSIFNTLSEKDIQNTSKRILTSKKIPVEKEQKEQVQVQFEITEDMMNKLRDLVNLELYKLIIKEMVLNKNKKEKNMQIMEAEDMFPEIINDIQELQKKSNDIIITTTVEHILDSNFENLVYDSYLNDLFAIVKIE